MSHPLLLPGAYKHCQQEYEKDCCRSSNRESEYTPNNEDLWSIILIEFCHLLGAGS